MLAKNIKIFRLTWLLLLLILISLVFYLQIVPSGQIKYSKNFVGRNYSLGRGFIGDFWPGASLNFTKSGLEVLGNMTFRLYPTQRFKTLKITINSQEPIANYQIGVASNRLNSIYDFKTGSGSSQTFVFDLSSADYNDKYLALMIKPQTKLTITSIDYEFSK